MRGSSFVQNVIPYVRKYRVVILSLGVLCLALVLFWMERTFAEDDETRYEMKTNVSMIQEDIIVGYQLSPEYEVVLQNSGTEMLTNLSAKTNCLVLFWEDEEGIRHYIRPEGSDEVLGTENTESGTEVPRSEEVALEKDGAETDGAETDSAEIDGSESVLAESTETVVPDPGFLKLPDTLAVEGELRLFACLPLGFEVGEVEDVLILSADELEKPVEVALRIQIVDSLGFDKGTLTPGEAMPEEPTTEEPTPEEPTTEEPGTEEPGTEEPGTEEPTTEEPGTEEPTTEELGTEEPTTEEPGTEEPTTGEPATEEPNSGEAISGESVTEEPTDSPVFTITNRVGGTLENGIFYAVSPNSYYEFTVSEEMADSVDQVICHWDSDMVSVHFEDGKAQVAVPSGVNGLCQFGYWDADGVEQIDVAEYVVSDRVSPKLDYERIYQNEMQYVRIRIREIGKMPSGIRNMQFMMDGEAVTPVLQTVHQKGTAVDGTEIMTEVFCDLAPEEGLHNIQVTAEDIAGNCGILNFQINIVADEPISVVLPTTFDLTVSPSLSENQIWSENIVICNESSFDVDVRIAKVLVQVKQEGERKKTCEMELSLLTADQVTREYELPMGLTRDLTQFSLAARKEEGEDRTLAQLQQSERVSSDDYAMLRLKGSLDTDTADLWQDKDLTVQLVFRFTKS